MKRLAAPFAIVLALFVMLNLLYRLGGSGVRVAGAGVSFGRGHDQQLYEVGPGVAVLVNQSNAVAGSTLPLVEPGPVAFPFSLLCGTYASNGFVHDEAKAETLLPGRIAVEPSLLQGERPRVSVKMTAAEAATTLRPLSTCNESCTTFNAAFLLVFALFAVVAPVLWWRGRAARHAGG